ncbi:hypothetical protein PsorP6_018099 [Peronosclerospora sorghi]|uniref:Uncharacterized protein n=1 Tax=Peronosclerospora sorghi TaxID=230839 RepID=A0ACC0WDF8_9STRA|nr:hypothetical protein PsorP6_018099 [Peronosclerospora sorghi]
MQRAKIILRDVFGYNAFRINQERTIVEAFSGRDVFVLMPTGGGKSLCFQLPACIDAGVPIVISPLVSLIQDQVQQMEALDVSITNLNGDQDYDNVQRPIISKLFSNDITNTCSGGVGVPAVRRPKLTTPVVFERAETLFCQFQTHTKKYDDQRLIEQQ